MDSHSHTKPEPRLISLRLFPVMLIALAVTIAVTFVLINLYAYIWQYRFPDQQIMTNLAGSTWGFLMLMAALAIVHELLHGITAAHYVASGWKGIKFGIMWQKFASPYCHCSEPMQRSQYQWFCLMPFLVLTVGLITIGFIVGVFPLVGWGIINGCASCADVWMAWKVRKLPRNTMVLDSPTEIGCLVYDMQ